MSAGSLDLFHAHQVPLGSSIYPTFGAPGALEHELGAKDAVWNEGTDWWPSHRAASYRAEDLRRSTPTAWRPGGGPQRMMMKGAVAEMAATGASAPQASREATCRPSATSAGADQASAAHGDACGRSSRLRGCPRRSRQRRMQRIRRVQHPICGAHNFSETVLAAAPGDRRLRFGGHRVQGAGVADFVEWLGLGLDRRRSPRATARARRAR